MLFYVKNSIPVAFFVFLRSMAERKMKREEKREQVHYIATLNYVNMPGPKQSGACDYVSP